jgi:hypothetical protein
MVKRKPALSSSWSTSQTPRPAPSGSSPVALRRFSGLQRGGHSIHYSIQLPRTGNVQVSWQAKSE